jgi:hypothetical protein
VTLKIAVMAAAALAAGASLSACQRAKPQVAALPLDMGATAAPLGEAPPPGGLPPAPPARIAALTDSRDAYAFPDRAWGMSWAFGDSPPDYAFYDEGVTPWVWVADDDSECLAEPVPGGERYYYFEPGAYTPFYVQDPSYGYGFANGQLVAIYAPGGREFAPSADPAAAATAGQYLARGRLLRQASASQPHQAVAAANWNARRGVIAAAHASFARDAAREPAWRAYHDQHQAQSQARFAPEATRRESWAAQTDSRLGQSGRAEREQRTAQSIAQGRVEVGRTQVDGAQLASAGSKTPRIGAPPRPGAALNRYAAAAPQPPGHERHARVEPGARHAVIAAPPAQAFAASHAERPQVERAQVQRAHAAQPPAVAHAATEHGSDAAFGERHAAPPQAAAHAFHAPAASPAPVHAAPPVAHVATPAPHVQPPVVAPPHPAPPAHAAPPPQAGGADKRH